ncbi:MAG: phosphoglucosamine mutase [Bacteroidales bacterium]|jgi:phosphomannomutase|nr:phosphoglucosamine mutase [Bacteroidales bacterium]MCK9447923.1 phosphoglucosamine mutase [Bacteroidales bacterium]MDD3701131.1 phosphoglucosamine mutase [Bacteroidales bacterium]MDY0368578.1 phosphoglucosamine mutase [Bacteroidales bacterium]
MALITSISGIRGTIGGFPGDTLSPLDIVRFTTAFVKLLQERQNRQSGLHIVVGRDARISGDMLNHLVCGTLMSMGAQVSDLGLSTTPTVELAVPNLKADGGIILTASHNPVEWNALKLLNEKGEFISAADGNRIIELTKSKIAYVDAMQLGTYTSHDGWIDKHIQMILELPLVDREAIQESKFKIAVDAVNSTGGIAVPALLSALGVDAVYPIHCEPTGLFAHNPEPLPEHLTDLAQLVQQKGADLGLSVDPDVDRLAIIDENGNMFGEEYTLVAVADYVLRHTPGPTVSNLSSSRALADITERYGQTYAVAAVGEVNVVEKMKAVEAVIGGEGNGGVIYPALHYGRDALVGIALFLTHLATQKKTCSEVRAMYPEYVMMKTKFDLKSDTEFEKLKEKVMHEFKDQKITTVDGVKIDFQEGWVHMRKSNTEPIIRLYAEAADKENVQRLIQNVIQTFSE